MIFLLNNKPVDALALIVHRSAEQKIGRMWVKKLREYSLLCWSFCACVCSNVTADKVIPRQLFEVPIQAVVGKRVIARETLSALRADVTAGLYGGTSVSTTHDILPSRDRRMRLSRTLRAEDETPRKPKGSKT